MTAKQIRDYPEFYGNTILDTFFEVKIDSPEYSPKEAWKWASHLHRNHPHVTQKVMEWDQKIPLQVQ